MKLSGKPARQQTQLDQVAGCLIDAQEAFRVLFPGMLNGVSARLRDNINRAVLILEGLRAQEQEAEREAGDNARQD